VLSIMINNSNVQVGVTEHGVNFYLTPEEIAPRDWYPPLIPVTEYWKGAVIYRGWINRAKYIIMFLRVLKSFDF